jgi:Glycosyl hydrolases family 15
VSAVPLWASFRRAVEVAARRMQKPAAVRRLAQLAPKEWSLAGTCDADDAAVIATNAALHRLAGSDGTGDWSRWGWEQISRIEWHDSASTLTLVGQAPLFTGRVALPLPTPGPLVEVILERLAWTTMLTTQVSLPSGGNLANRYRTAEGIDGLAGEEGAFLLCTFWLAEALALTDQVDRARAVFERAAGFANDLGLLAEEVDPDTGQLLGNFPQAFSHIGLVNAAWAISEAERRARSSR